MRAQAALIAKETFSKIMRGALAIYQEIAAFSSLNPIKTENYIQDSEDLPLIPTQAHLPDSVFFQSLQHRTRLKYLHKTHT